MRRLGVRFEAPEPAPRPEQVIGVFPATPGVYLHVPFCRTICPFCPYNKVGYRADLAADYFSALEREASLYLSAHPGPFTSLYVGGGTPTLCLAELEGLLGRLPVTGERAIEVLPSHMTPPGAARIRDLGFDYVSLGVQSFDEGVLRRLGRPGSPQTNRTAIESALGVFDCVDVDLIFDSAYDDPATLLDDLTTCFRYEVDQVSTYPLMRFGFTPFGKGRHARRREHAALREATRLAESWGYERRSVWTFNRRGSAAYSSITRPYYLGLGAGSASFAGRLFFANHFGLDQYRRDLDEGRLPVARVVRLSAPAAAAYRAFWQAYTGRVPLRAGDPLLDHPVASALRRASRVVGWARREGDGVVLTGKGYDRYHDLERWVTYHLIEPLWAELMEEHTATSVPPRAVPHTTALWED